MRITEGVSKEQLILWVPGCKPAEDCLPKIKKINVKKRNRIAYWLDRESEDYIY